jgi:hypothetical protein
MTFMKTIACLIIAGALVFGFGQFGYAQTTAPAAPAAPAAPKAKVPMSAEDMATKAKDKECSAKANAKGLHCHPITHKGCKERLEFREKCKAS